MRQETVFSFNPRDLDNIGLEVFLECLDTYRTSLRDTVFAAYQSTDSLGELVRASLDGWGSVAQANPEDISKLQQELGLKLENTASLFQSKEFAGLWGDDSLYRLLREGLLKAVLGNELMLLIEKHIATMVGVPAKNDLVPLEVGSRFLEVDRIVADAVEQSGEELFLMQETKGAPMFIGDKYARNVAQKVISLMEIVGWQPDARFVRNIIFVVQTRFMPHAGGYFNRDTQDIIVFLREEDEKVGAQIVVNTAWTLFEEQTHAEQPQLLGVTHELHALLETREFLRIVRDFAYDKKIEYIVEGLDPYSIYHSASRAVAVVDDELDGLLSRLTSPNLSDRLLADHNIDGTYRALIENWLSLPA